MCELIEFHMVLGHLLRDFDPLLLKESEELVDIIRRGDGP